MEYFIYIYIVYIVYIYSLYSLYIDKYKYGIQLLNVRFCVISKMMCVYYIYHLL